MVRALEIFATVAAISTFGLQLIGRKLIICKVAEAECAALTEGAERSRLALVSISGLEAIAAGYKIAPRVEGGAVQRKPIDCSIEGRPASVSTPGWTPPLQQLRNALGTCEQLWMLPHHKSSAKPP